MRHLGAVVRRNEEKTPLSIAPPHYSSHDAMLDFVHEGPPNLSKVFEGVLRNAEANRRSICVSCSVLMHP